MSIIPAWVVAMFALVASGALATVRPMPWRIRFSLVVPVLYFAGVYFYVNSQPPLTVSVDWVRLGLLVIFFSIIANSILVRITSLKGRI